MSKDNLLTRREFTVESALAMLAGVAITITGCDDSAPPAPSPLPTDKTGAVSTDAGHSHTGAANHCGSVHGRKRDYADPYRRLYSHTHGGPISSRAHTNQRRNACAENVVQ